MNDQGTEPTADRPGSPPSEEEMRRRLAEELKKIDVRDVLLQSVVTLVNLGGQRLGLASDTSDVRDLDQARLAIEAVRGLLPLLDETAPGEMAPLRDALAHLQVAYAREASASGEQTTAPAEAENEPREGTGEGPKAPSGGLWVPPGSQT